MPYRDDLVARIELLENRVAELESTAPIRKGEEEPKWTRTRGLIFNETQYYSGPEQCEFCKHWDSKNMQWGKEISHERYTFDSNKLYANCNIRPGAACSPEKKCASFYPANRFWMNLVR